ncbi:hypothetical protein CEY16_13695 [Halalkalibacillus sediminis]|uniref:Uncharacterized protein n=1 Tax=Halalkalibacillus sediminis TaxID=2018042 RepID=A0A2I0QRA0_9BACI|nr:hypothetical protein [Halalkalibacillus sediminis]PKR76862.1 hypothetical protein CEY16_13695 [Halalkalibacillus sediminis]
MRKTLPYVVVSLLVITSILTVYYYDKNQKAESEIIFKEMLIFRNHVTGTVRAVNAQDENMMKDTAHRIIAFETFHSKRIEFEHSELALNNFESAVRMLATVEPQQYPEVYEVLDDIHDVVINYLRKDMKEKDIIHSSENVEPYIETFVNQVEQLSKK